MMNKGSKVRVTTADGTQSFEGTVIGIEPRDGAERYEIQVEGGWLYLFHREGKKNLLSNAPYLFGHYQFWTVEEVDDYWENQKSFDADTLTVGIPMEKLI